MVGVNSGSNIDEVRHLIFSTTNEVDGWFRTGSSIRVVTRRAPSSLSKGLKGLFCIRFSGFLSHFLWLDSRRQSLESLQTC